MEDTHATVLHKCQHESHNKMSKSISHLIYFLLNEYTVITIWYRNVWWFKFFHSLNQRVISTCCILYVCTHEFYNFSTVLFCCCCDWLLFLSIDHGIKKMLFQCWTSVVDGGPALKQHWFNASCLLVYIIKCPHDMSRETVRDTYMYSGSIYCAPREMIWYVHLSSFIISQIISYFLNTGIDGNEHNCLACGFGNCHQNGKYYKWVQI